MNIRFCGNLHCMNTVGSYECRCKDGYDVKIVGNDQGCHDIDECSRRNSCPLNSICENTIGSFKCLCKTGYEGPECNDINECLAEANACDTYADCSNTIGSFDCTCKEGFLGSGHQLDCLCETGFYPNESAVCVDRDECSSGTHDCDSNAFCINTTGSYNCNCENGYYGSGKVCVRGQCNDSSCPKNQKCVSPTTIYCDCVDGFQKANNTCIDSNECLQEVFPCHKSADCSNTEGSYACSCNQGFVGNGTTCVEGQCDETVCSGKEKKVCLSATSNECGCIEGFQMVNNSCIDKVECLSQSLNCPENSQCVNEIGSYRCVCFNGYEGQNCTKTDQCESGLHQCDGLRQCVDKIGGYECECKTGFNEHKNGTCIDHDECGVSPDPCFPSPCINLIGNYTCKVSKNYFFTSLIKVSIKLS